MIIRLLGLIIIAILSVQVPGTVHVRTDNRVLKWYYLCINWPHHPPKKIFFIIYYIIIFKNDKKTNVYVYTKQ